MYVKREEVVKRIKAALVHKTGQQWSVHGDRGTAWGWITIEAPKARRVSLRENPDYISPWETPHIVAYTEYRSGEDENYFTSLVDCKVLARALGLHKPAHNQGVSISPDKWEFYLNLAEA